MKHLGIDISKEWLDYACCNQHVEFQDEVRRVDNTPKGIYKMLRHLNNKGFIQQDTWICFEHTGHYGMLLCSLLQAEGYTFTMLSPIEVKKSLGLVRGKDDQVDARRLAEYGATKKHKLKPGKLPSESLLKIKQLFALRKLFVKQKTALINHRKAQQEMQEVVDNSFGISSTDHMLDTLKSSIKTVEAQILTLVKKDKPLNKSYNLLTSIKGVGPTLAWGFLIHTQNFKSFDDPRKFLCYAGMAPFANSSGKHTGKSHTSSYRHKHLKKYYTRKVEEGKNKLSVLNAVNCKLVYRAFAVTASGTPYVIHGRA